MRLIQATCTVDYKGRGETHLEQGERVILIKDDGSVLIHGNTGLKPLNYMGARPKVHITENNTPNTPHTIQATSKHETILITLIKTTTDTTIKMTNNTNNTLQRHGTEKQLQEHLANPTNFKKLFPNYEFATREFQTGNGPVDLLGINNTTNSCALIEIKRKARPKDTYQVIRYKEAITNSTKQAKHQNQTHIHNTKNPNDYQLPIQNTQNIQCYLVSQTKSIKGTKEQCQKLGITLITLQN